MRQTKTALQYCKSCVTRTWRFPTAFLRSSGSHVRLPRLGSADGCFSHKCRVECLTLLTSFVCELLQTAHLHLEVHVSQTAPSPSLVVFNNLTEKGCGTLDQSLVHLTSCFPGKYSSPFFSAKSVVKSGVKFGEIFRATFSRVLGVRRKISPKFHFKNGVKTENFTQMSLCWGAAQLFSWETQRAQRSKKFEISIEIENFERE